MTIRKETQHHFGRRSATHDYTRPGIYHITIKVAESLGRPLGTLTGDHADSAAITFTAVGTAVEHELLTAITAHYEMVTVDAYVIMPEHLHFILIVRDPIVSKSGQRTHLGQVIAGFKKGCNRAFWAIQEAGSWAGSSENRAGSSENRAGSSENRAGSPENRAGEPPGAMSPPAPAARSVSAPGGSPARHRPPSAGSSDRVPLFAPLYCDVMPVEPGQLETQRAYIRNNPRSRWLRTHNRACLQTRRGGIDTALTVAALCKYLRQECSALQATDDALAAIEQRLLLANGHIACDSYGDRALLTRRLLPVVCHRRYRALLARQKACCLEEAARGTVLVSARISPGEQEIIDECANHGFPVILVADNGFPSVYHPPTQRIDLCAEGRLLIVTPWQYEYRGKNEAVTVPYCKTMNCIAQAISRTKDSWWQTYQES